MLVDDCVARWQLALGEPYPPGAAGHAVRAELPDGTPAVLKLSTPHHESEQEADALERWDGAGAVRQLARDDERHALLLERCEPGTSLSESTDALDRSFELGHSKRDVLYRLDRLASELGLDRDRALGWTVAQTVAWSGGSDYVETHVETVRWLLEDA